MIMHHRISHHVGSLKGQHICRAFCPPSSGPTGYAACDALAGAPPNGHQSIFGTLQNHLARGKMLILERARVLRMLRGNGKCVLNHIRNKKDTPFWMVNYEAIYSTTRWLINMDLTISAHSDWSKDLMYPKSPLPVSTVKTEPENRLFWSI